MLRQKCLSNHVTGTRSFMTQGGWVYEGAGAELVTSQLLKLDTARLTLRTDVLLDLYVSAMCVCAPSFFETFPFARRFCFSHMDTPRHVSSKTPNKKLGVSTLIPKPQHSFRS